MRNVNKREKILLGSLANDRGFDVLGEERLLRVEDLVILRRWKGLKNREGFGEKRGESNLHGERCRERRRGRFVPRRGSIGNKTHLTI